MSNHIGILIHSRDVQELIELLASDELPECYHALADQMIDRLGAALEERQPRVRAA